MKVLTKIIVILMVALLLISIAKPTFADEEKKDMFSTVKEKMEQNNNIGQKEIVQVGTPIIVFIRNFALVLGVVMLSIIGIKYMIGSVEEKANYKRTLIPLVIGIIIVLSATVLVSVIYESVISVVDKEEDPYEGHKIPSDDQYKQITEERIDRNSSGSGHDPNYTPYK